MSETVKKRGLMPKLRFPGFPSGWDNVSFGTLYEFGKSYQVSRDNLNTLSGLVGVVHYGDIHTKLPSHVDFAVTNVPYLNEASDLSINPDDAVSVGDLIFADASEDLADVGKAVEVVGLAEKPISAGMHTILAKRRTDRPEPGFGGFYIRSPFAQSQIRHEAQGTKVFGISGSRLARIRVLLPFDSVEQKKIAECLESLDELIAAAREKVEALKRHKKGLLQQLFPAEGKTTPRLRFPEFSTAGEWLEGSIGELGDVVTGTTPSTAKREFYGKDVLFASPADISAHRIVSETANGLSTLGAEQARLVAPGSSLFVCIGSTIGKVAQNAEACATNQQINTVVPDRERFDVDFVYYLLLTKVNIVRELAGKQAVPLVSKTVFCSVKVEFPLIDEQRAVASVMNELDRAQSAGHHFLGVLRNHKAALMQQLFPNVDEAEA